MIQPISISGLGETAFDIAGAVHNLYAQCPPQDRRDAIIVMHPLLRNSLERQVATMRDWTPPPLAPPADPAGLIVDPPAVERIFGLPIETSDQIDPGCIELWAENATDRAFRRARERGQTITMMAPIAWPDLVPPPTPTLKALLRHWAKQWTRGAR